METEIESREGGGGGRRVGSLREGGGRGVRESRRRERSHIRSWGKRETTR
jgi:hypothetical protein